MMIHQMAEIIHMRDSMLQVTRNDELPGLTSLPLYLISPLVRLKEKTAMESESWFATIKNCPLWSNWKWRGVSPRVWKKPTWARVPRMAFSLLLKPCFTRNTVMDSWPRFETMTNRPDWCTPASFQSTLNKLDRVRTRLAEQNEYVQRLTNTTTSVHRDRECWRHCLDGLD